MNDYAVEEEENEAKEQHAAMGKRMEEVEESSAAKVNLLLLARERA